MIAPRVVLDTNIIFAALKSADGASAKLLSLAVDEEVTIFVSELLWEEWAGVLRRSTSILECSAQTVETFLDLLARFCVLQEVYFLWRPTLRDIADDKVLECAVASQAEFLVTFNKKDFAGSEAFNPRLVTPGELLQILEKTRQTEEPTAKREEQEQS